MTERDWYSVLGVSPDASQKQIRDAYIRISRVIHPDRFDPEKQPKEWEQANEMLKEVNQAYEVLSDPNKRTAFDFSRRTKSSSKSNTEPGARPSKRKSRSSRSGAGNSQTNDKGYQDPANSEFAHGTAHFDDLPKHVQQRLLERQTGKSRSQCQVETEGVRWKWFWAVILGTLLITLPILFLEIPFSKQALLWLALIEIGISLLLGYQAHWIWKWSQSTLQCRFYVTPLYFIKTYLDTIKWWPIWKLKDLKATHNYRNGSYQDTEIKLIFPTGTELVGVKSKQDVEKFLEWVRRLSRKMQRAAVQKRWQYFEENDDFASARSQYRKSNETTKSKIFVHVIPILIGLCVVLYAYSMASLSPGVKSSYPSPVTSQNQERSHNTDLSSPPFDDELSSFLQERSQSSNRSSPSTFNQAPQPLPSNETLQRYHSREAVAPLEIKTRGSDRHYFVKLVDSSTNRKTLTLFIRGGRSAEISVPLGTFRLKYATGETWYGSQYRFGPDTRYNEADRLFQFTDDGYQYSGYTVELFLQDNGNLRTEQISPDDF